MATTTQPSLAAQFAGRRLTAEQFWELQGVEGMQYELVEGVLIEMPVPGGVHNYIAFTIARILAAFVDAHPLGFVFGDTMGYIPRRNPDTVRIPDASFISFARGGHALPRRDWPLAPDLAVEVVSPNDRADAVLEKVHQYLAAGTRLVWVVWSRMRFVTVYDADGTREYSEGDTLDGGEVLPGFAVAVSRLFPPSNEGA